VSNAGWESLVSNTKVASKEIKNQERCGEEMREGIV